jgi:uncharacterized protein (DUF2267 family)
MAELPILENNIHQAMDWIYAVEEACHWDEENQKKAVAILRAVLHALRKLLPLEQAAQLSTQLSLIIRGIFFENWHLHVVVSQEIKKGDFLASIAKALYPYQNIDPEETVRSVFRVLREKLAAGTLEDILKNMLKEIQDLYINPSPPEKKEAQ